MLRAALTLCFAALAAVAPRLAAAQAGGPRLESEEVAFIPQAAPNPAAAALPWFTPAPGSALEAPSPLKSGARRLSLSSSVQPIFFLGDSSPSEPAMAVYGRVGIASISGELGVLSSHRGGFSVLFGLALVRYGVKLWSPRAGQGLFFMLPNLEVRGTAGDLESFSLGTSLAGVRYAFCAGEVGLFAELRAPIVAAHLLFTTVDSFYESSTEVDVLGSASLAGSFGVGF